MPTVLVHGTPVHLLGRPPAEGDPAPEFTLVRGDLATVTLADYPDPWLILNVFPSLDTSVCAASVRRFNREAAGRSDRRVLGISMDLPFAQARFCAAEGIDRVETLSAFRGGFAGYGLQLGEGPLAGLLARAVLVLDPDRRVKHVELVPEITNEPDYVAALTAAG